MLYINVYLFYQMMEVLNKELKNMVNVRFRSKTVSNSSKKTKKSWKIR